MQSRAPQTGAISGLVEADGQGSGAIVKHFENSVQTGVEWRSTVNA
jgi:hypothetical protein